MAASNRRILRPHKGFFEPEPGKLRGKRFADRIYAREYVLVSTIPDIPPGFAEDSRNMGSRLRMLNRNTSPDWLQPTLRLFNSTKRRLSLLLPRFPVEDEETE